MRATGFLKGALAGGTGAAAVMVTTVALAGTGVGGVFNLGQTNTVNATSTLSGTTAAAQLAVTNGSTASAATGIKVTTQPFRPPFVVNRTARNVNLNADYVDGFHANGLARVAQVTGNRTVTVGVEYADFATVTIVAPVKGFVTLDASILGEAIFPTNPCTNCYLGARVRDNVADTYSRQVVGDLGAGGLKSLNLAWVFPVTAGTRTFTLQAGYADNTESGRAALFSNAQITAEYVPFGYNGGTALEAPQSASSSREGATETRGAVRATK